MIQMGFQVFVKVIFVDAVDDSMVHSITQWTTHHKIHNKLDLMGAQRYFSGLHSKTSQRGITDAPGCLSAHHRGIVVAIVAVNVEICHLSTVGDQVVDRVDSIGLDNSRESGHLALRTRVPDHTLDKPLSRRSAGVEINLGGRVGQLHRVFP